MLERVRELGKQWKVRNPVEILINERVQDDIDEGM